MQTECKFGKNDGRLTRDRLLEVLNYDPMSGVFRWKVRNSNRVKIGDVAGVIAEGYVKINIDGVRYPAHRLAWLYVFGAWPDGRLDHRDLDRSNNRIDNLRIATQSQNSANRAMQANNKSGFKGVSWSTKRQKWAVYLKKEGKGRFLGYFDDPEDGHLVWLKAAEEAHGEFLRAA